MPKMETIITIVGGAIGVRGSMIEMKIMMMIEIVVMIKIEEKIITAIEKMPATDLVEEYSDTYSLEISS
ncbi:MAG: hypothetical protein Q7K26_03765 [bacterium]|nr:hypothetical protein [bacterium]